MNAISSRPAAADPIARAARGLELNAKIAQVLQKRTEAANGRYAQRARAAFERSGGAAAAPRAWSESAAYWTDAFQRSILFWDTLRERGNRYLEHVRAGTPPVLHFKYEPVLDARTFPRPANYALVRIVPPAGVAIDPKLRPYLIIDPRAGHGPGIGGFKDDSQVGVALKAGHPVYFVIFYPEPVPGQTLLDVCAAEREFVHKVRSLHPASAKPAIIGNCQGGWAAMMLAASEPDQTGPLVINGAPMSYWGGAWTEGEGDNPMRYAGGLLGGTWLASLTSDLGAGVFDGAHLVQNFENLNPANTFWDKFYHLYANVDTEAPRFLDFERWWGGYFLMNREEIEWITQNLFVGNQAWDKKGEGDTFFFDLKKIRVPIVLFASMGDNITPPQQAFNWVADVYGSTEEIKARGQVIVGLLHQDIGHLGIFVSGKVAKKEHAQIVSVLKSIEALTPGLYAMEIREKKGADGKVEYEVAFQERQLEEITARLNKVERQDEKPFEAVNAFSEFNQRAYELFAQPLVQSMANEFTAKLGRQFHSLRFQRWAFSDFNPWLAWVGPAAQAVRAEREAVEPGNAVLKFEKAASDTISATLDYYRTVRDAVTEASFFETYGNAFSLYIADKREAEEKAAPVLEGRELPFVAEALASIEEGGYPEALARVACLLARKGEPLLLSRLALKEELIKEYRDLLPDLPREQWRRVRGEQELIVRYEPERALATLPKLLADPADRDKLVRVVQRLLNDERVQRTKPSTEQIAMVEHIGETLQVPNASKVWEGFAQRAAAAPAASRRRSGKKG